MIALRVGTRSLPLPAGLPLAIAYVILYVALDWVSALDPQGGPLGITPWNPPPGLSLFLLLRFGLSFTPWLFVASLAAEVVVRGVPASWPLALAICSLFTLVYGGMAALLRGPLHFDAAFRRMRDVTVFAAAALLASLLVALAYVGLYRLVMAIPGPEIGHAIAEFWIGDLIGIIVTTPFLLAFTERAAMPPRGTWWEAGLQALAIVAALAVVFASGVGQELKLFYLLFLPLVWIALRRGLAGTTAAVVVTQIGVIVALELGRGAAGTVLDFQVLMLAVALTGLFLAAAVEERLAAERKLRDKQVELDRSMRAAAASELASTLAHELNQPLSAIATYTRSCELMLERGDPDGEVLATMRQVVSEAKRAATVVRRLREFVRTGALRLRSLPVLRLLEGVAESARANAVGHGVTLAVTAEPDLPPVAGDRLQLETVLHNLVTNAIDALASHRGPRTVRLSAVRAGPETVRVSVADTGPGVAPDMLPTLFEPLATSKAHGLGLGLAISRTIVEAHGGRLSLEPTATGATFSLTLPIAH
ncbi:MAG: ATP-binding protein [Burkholderiales bacterium]